MNKEKDPFKEIKDLNSILKVLEKRLPISANIHTVASNYNQFSKYTKWFILESETEIGENTWIIAIFKRKDYHNDVMVSAPKNVSEVPEEVKKAFINTKMIDYNVLHVKDKIIKYNFKEPYIFASIDRAISSFFVDLCYRIKSNSVSIYPCNVYYMDNETAKNLQLEDLTNNNIEGEIKELDPEFGKKFLLDSWKFSRDGSDHYIDTMLEGNKSAGVYIKGKNEPVCGLLNVSYGLMAMLYTDHSFRNRGYGGLCMKYLMKELAKENNKWPSCTVELTNKISNSFMLKTGLKLSNQSDFIFQYPRAYAKK